MKENEEEIGMKCVKKRRLKQEQNENDNRMWRNERYGNGEEGEDDEEERRGRR